MQPDSKLAKPIIIEERLAEQSRSDELESLRSHLVRKPPEIPARYFYDDRGSLLFEAITTTDEYYQTRTERALLDAIADDVIEATGAVELVELGSGASLKTRVLLDAMQRAGVLEAYAPYDVNRSMVEQAATDLCAIYPGMTVNGVIADFVADVGDIPGRSPRLIIFLGGTIGNFDRESAVGFLSRVASHMEPNDHLLLGTDLIKDPARIEAAYNDSRGLTAAFNRNILTVLNQKFGADFAPGRFDHRAVYNAEEHRLEMHLVSSTDQVVSIEAVDLTLGLPQGHHLLTEISVKYDRALATELLHDSGLELERWYPDKEALFALSLATKV